MASAYACADFVAARAGSNTVFELLALQKPSLLIPLANRRSRGDQAENAEYFRRRGLCRVLREDDLSAESLAGALFSLAADGSLRQNLRRAGIPRGNEAIVRAIGSVLSRRADL